MKALGLEILNYVSALFQLGAIDDGQRDELASATRLAMSNDNMYPAIASRLESLAGPMERDSIARDFCEKCANIIRSSCVQPIG